MLVTVMATHYRSRYIVLEDLEPALTSISCNLHSTQTILEFTLGDSDLFQRSRDAWSKERSLLVVTNHPGCNPENERGVYK
jgi:hypothetical protein